MSAEHIVQIVLESEYGGYQDPVARSIIRALSDAGLLARTLPTREQIASRVSSAMDASWDDAMEYTALPSVAADAVLDLLKGQDR